MPRYDFQSPGANAFRGVQEYLTQQELLRRQSMMDRLTQQNTQSQIASRQAADTRAGSAEQRAMAAAEMEQQLAESRLRTEALNQGSAVAGVTTPGTPMTDDLRANLGPLASVLTETTPEAFTPVPGVQEPVAPDSGVLPSESLAGVMTPESSVFRGTPEQQSRQEAEDRLEGVLNDPNVTPDVKTALAAGVSPGANLFRPETQTVGQGQRFYEQDADGTWKMVAEGMQPTSVMMNQPGPDGQMPLPAGITPEAITLSAWQYLQTGKMPTLGMGASNVRMAILNEASRLSQESEASGQGAINPMFNAGMYRAETNTMTQLQKNLSAISAYKNTAKTNMDVFRGVVSKIADTGRPILNAPVRNAQRFIQGDTDQAAFNAAYSALYPEIARLLFNPQLTGILSDSARLEAQQLISADSTVGQFNEALRIIESDMASRETNMQAELVKLQNNIQQRGPFESRPEGVTESVVTVEMPDGSEVQGTWEQVADSIGSGGGRVKDYTSPEAQAPSDPDVIRVVQDEQGNWVRETTP